MKIISGHIRYSKKQTQLKHKDNKSPVTDQAVNKTRILPFFPMFMKRRDFFIF